MGSGGCWYEATPVVCEDRGEIVSCAVAFQRQVWVGGARASFGGIGAVATIPTAQGKGGATSVLNYCQDVLKTQGHRLGVLFCAIPDFYQRLGWSCVEEDWIEFSLDRPLLLSQATAYRFSQISETSFSKDAALLDRRTAENSGGAVIRSEGLWQEYGNWQREDMDLFWGAFDADRLVAYVRGRRVKSGVLLQEIICLPEHQTALLGLLEAQRQKVNSAGAVTFEGCLSSQHDLIHALNSYGVPLRWRKTSADTSIMMIKSLRQDSQADASLQADNDRFLTTRDFETSLPWRPRTWWAIDRF